MKEEYPLDNRILSLQRFNSVPDHIFALTNYSVLCLTFKPDTEHILTRQHFRHMYDFSLRMTAVRYEERMSPRTTVQVYFNLTQL